MHLCFAVAFNTTTLVPGSIAEKKLSKLGCADKKLLEESCVRNFRNPLFAKLLLFGILGHFQKLFWAKIIGVRNFSVLNFRTFTVLKCIIVGTLCVQVSLQFYIVQFETLQALL